MTPLDLDIRKWILKTLLAARGPLPEAVLKMSIISAFPHVAFTDGDLLDHIKSCEDVNLIAGTNDDVSGVMWDLTSKGKIKAHTLR